MIDFLKEKDGNGYSKNSAIRLIALIWVVVFSIVWGVVSIMTKTICPIPNSVITATVIFITGKVVQKFGERK